MNRLKRIMRLIAVVTLILMVFILVFFSLKWLLVDTLKLTDEIFGSFVSAIIVLLSGIFAVFRLQERIDIFNNRYLASDKCRIVVLGDTGVGKSSLVTSLLSRTRPYRFESTQKIGLYESVVYWGVQNKLDPEHMLGPDDLKNTVKIPVIIADYRGKDLSGFRKIISEIFGKGNYVNCVLFVTDFFEPPKDLGIPIHEMSSPEIDQQILDQYKPNTDAKIRERIDNHVNEYFGGQTIRFLLDDILETMPVQYIGVVANKFDLLKEAGLRQDITTRNISISDEISTNHEKEHVNSQLTSIVLEQYTVSLLTQLVKKIETYSKNRYAGEIGIHFVSGLTGEGVNEMLDNILRAYYQYRKES